MVDIIKMTCRRRKSEQENQNRAGQKNPKTEALFNWLC